MKFLLLLTQVGGAGVEGLDTLTNGAAPEEAVNTVKELKFFDLIMDGGWYIMIPLGILLLVALFILFERMMAVNRAASSGGSLNAAIKDYISNGKVEAAKNLCMQTNSPSARLLEKGIAHIGRPMDDIRASIENAGKLEIYKLERNLSVLATVAGAAPMIGFLGTVIGMIITFHEMAIAPNVEISALSGGIMQAMVTTVTGLIIGIIAYISYNLLVARVDKVVHQMEASSIDFLDLLQEPGK